jgi:hypothetical protein
MSGVDESDYCPDVDDIDDMVIIAVPAGPDKVVNTAPKMDYRCGSCAEEFGDDKLKFEDHMSYADCTSNKTLPDTNIPDFLEDLGIQDHERLTLFERQSVLHAIRECDKFSDKYKDELGLKLSILWESV